MPIYSFKTEDGDLVEHHFSFSKYDEVRQTQDEDGWVEVDGVRLKRDISADLTQRRSSGDGIWPAASDSLAYEPKQVREAMERDRKAGVPTSYDGDGRPILRSEKHRRAYYAMRGVQDLKSYT